MESFNQFLIRIITIILIFVNTILFSRRKEELIVNEVKSRMLKLGISQVDMILELQKRGFEVPPPQMSSILRGVYTYPKAKQILAECEKILDGRSNDYN